jgi:LysR family transcriptional regulator for metE and metH
MYLELRHLRTLRAIEETGSLARAADRMHLTESALSHQIKSIEHQFGVTLFFRRSRPVRLTAAGEQLLALARRVLPDVEAVESSLHALSEGNTGRLHVAMECHSCFQWLLPTMDVYRRDWPGVEMDLSLGFSFHPLPALVRGDIDLVVTSDPEPSLAGIHYAPLFRYEVCLAVPAGSPLAVATVLEPGQLVDQTLITYPVCRDRLDIFNSFLEPAGVEPASIRTAELTVMIIQLVASRRGVAALPNWALAEYADRDDIVTRRLGSGVWSTLYAAVRTGEEQAPYMRAFIERARSLSSEQLQGIQTLPDDAEARDSA